MYRVCIQIIILVARKITCGMKGQEKKIFQYYMIQRVGTYVERNDNNDDSCHFALEVNFVIQE